MNLGAAASPDEAGSASPVGLVLCGGRSKRMGRDKASIGDPPWAHRVAEALENAGCRPTILVGGDPGLARGRWRHVPDDLPGEGPAAALATAIRLHPGKDLVVAACDLPELVPAAVTTLIEAVCHGAASAAYEVDSPQWSLVAVASTAAAAVAGRVSEGERSMHGALGSDVRFLQPVDPSVIMDVDEPG